MFSKHQNKTILAITNIKFKLLSEYDDLSGLIGPLSHDDLNSLDDLDSLFDLKNTKMQALYILSGFLGLSHLESLFLWD